MAGTETRSGRAESRGATSTEEATAALLPSNYMTKDFLERIDQMAASDNSSFKSELAPPRFLKAATIGTRVAVWAWLTGFGVWLARRHTPTQYEVALPSVVIAIIYNIGPNLASTMRNVLQAFAGTFFAIGAAWLLYHVPSNYTPIEAPIGALCSARRLAGLGNVTGSAQDTLYTWYCESSTGLVTADQELPEGAWTKISAAFITFSFFSAITLAANVSMPFKTFALVSAVGFFLDFANPGKDTDNYMTFGWTSHLTVMLATQLLGSIVAILAMLLPPMTAHGSAKVLTARATKATSELLFSVTEYYCGQTKTLAINVWNSQLVRNREDMNTEEMDLDSAWWEHFDWCRPGITRNLMKDHVGMLRDVDRRLNIMQLVVLREKFEDRHNTVMKEMRGPMLNLASKVGDCLLNCALSAADGHFTEEEKEQLMKQKNEVEAAIEETTSKWMAIRGSVKDALSKELREENFFLVELSTVGRMVAEFTEKITDDQQRPQPKNLALEATKHLFSLKRLRDKQFRNFILRNWISLNLAWWWSSLANSYSSALPINVVFMLTELPGSSMLTNLQKLEASVLGSLAGTVLYRALHACNPITKFLKLTSLFVFELLSMFIANYTTEYANVGLLLAVYGGGKLMSPCAEQQITNGEVLQLNSAEFKNLRVFTYAMCIVSAVDTLMMPEPVCDLARRKFGEALDTSFGYLKEFLDGNIGEGKEIWEETGKKTKAVEDAIKEAEGVIASSDQEPRLWKGPFKTSLFRDLCARERNLQLKIQVMIRRCQGADSGGLMPKFQKCPNWAAVKDDMMETIKIAETVVKKVLNYDGFGKMSVEGFDDIMGKTGIEGLEKLEALAEDIQQLDLKGDTKSLELGEVARSAIVLETLDLVVQEIADMLMLAVQDM